MEELITVKQSGHLGDMIYSLSATKTLAELYNKKIHFLVGFNEPNGVPGHPSGKTCMNETSYQYIKPLLEAQPYIEIVSRHTNEYIQYSFDAFRYIGLNLAAGDLRMVHGYIYPETQSDLTKPALITPSKKLDYLYLTNAIVINLSNRYRNPNINYSFLKEYGDNLYFVGLDDEYKHFIRNYNVTPKRVHVKDAFHMAQILSSASLFIGNQSSTFAIAEQLKVPRLLEVFNRAPNVIPMGTDAHYYQTTESLTYLTKKLYEKSKIH